MIGTETQTENQNASVEIVTEPDYTLSDLGSSFLEKLRLLWEKRRYLRRVFLAGLVCGVLVAFLLPAQYQSSVQLMPPDSQSSSGLAMLAALTAKTGGGIGGMRDCWRPSRNKRFRRSIYGHSPQPDRSRSADRSFRFAQSLFRPLAGRCS